MCEPWLAVFIETFGAPCPACATPLVVPADACPKCRTQLRLGMKITESYLLAWGICIATSGLMAGFGMFLLFLFLLRGNPPTSRDPFITTIICYANMSAGAFMTLAMIFLLAARKVFCRWPRRVQWIMASATLMMLAAMVVSFGWTVR